VQRDEPRYSLGCREQKKILRAGAMARRAVEHLRRMRGGAQAHLMRCDDGQYYVVKFQNNPQGVRILANEMLAGWLALALGLPVSEPEVVEVSQWLVEHSPEMYIQIGNERVRCASGLQFGSRYPCDPLRSPVYDFLPDSLLGTVANRNRFPAILVFDKWTCNCDARQLVFHRISGHRTDGGRTLEDGSAGDLPQHAATMIDQGFCFNANQWDFPDAPLRGLYSRLAVYQDVMGWEAFEPMLSQVEHLAEDFLEEAAARVPPEWYEGKAEELGALVNELAERRHKVVSLLEACCHSAKRPFPNWKDGVKSHEAM